MQLKATIQKMRMMMKIIVAILKTKSRLIRARGEDQTINMKRRKKARYKRGKGSAEGRNLQKMSMTKRMQEFLKMLLSIINQVLSLKLL